MTMTLDVDSPEKVAQVLRLAAERFRESTDELKSAWQDEHAGKVWTTIAKILDRAATSCERAVETHFG